MLLQGAFESLCYKTCPDYSMIPYTQFFFSNLFIIPQFIIRLVCDHLMSHGA